MEPLLWIRIWGSLFDESFKGSHLLLISGLESLRIVNDDAWMLVALKPFINVVFSSRPLIFLRLEKESALRSIPEKVCTYHC